MPTGINFRPSVGSLFRLALIVMISLQAGATTEQTEPVQPGPESRSPNPASPEIRQDGVFVTDSGLAEFHSSVPLHKFTGRSEHLTGMIDFEQNLIDFYLDLRSLDTGNSRRDRDMYRTLDTDNYPYAEFTGEIVSMDADLEDHNPATITVQGVFTVHGVEREQTVEGTLSKENGAIRLEAGWVQSLSAHDIEPPGILFYRVRDEVEIHIKATLQQTDSPP